MGYARHDHCLDVVSLQKVVEALAFACIIAVQFYIREILGESFGGFQGARVDSLEGERWSALDGREMLFAGEDTRPDECNSDHYFGGSSGWCN